jgi:hypothetical protein
MDDALAVNRALRTVDVSWSVGMMVAIGGVVVRRVLVVVRVASSSIDLFYLVFGGGHSRGSMRVARVDVCGLFQAALSSKVIVFLQFLLVLLVQFIVVDVCSDAAAAAAVAVAGTDRDGDVVDG